METVTAILTSLGKIGSSRATAGAYPIYPTQERSNDALIVIALVALVIVALVFLVMKKR